MEVGLENGEQRAHVIPSQKIVIVPATNQPEHVAKDVIMASQGRRRNPQHSAELTVDLFISAASERKRQGRRDAVVTLGYIAVVPQVQGTIRVGDLGQRRDRPRLQKIKSVSFEGPFDIL